MLFNLILVLIKHELSPPQQYIIYIYVRIKKKPCPIVFPFIRRRRVVYTGRSVDFDRLGVEIELSGEGFMGKMRQITIFRIAAERPVETAGRLQHVQHQLGVIIPIPAPCKRGRPPIRAVIRGLAVILNTRDGRKKILEVELTGF